MKLTYKALKAKHPCENQLEIYLANFPDNLEIKKSDLIKAVKLRLSISWFVTHFLSRPAWDAYNKATAPARDAYNKATASAVWEIIKG